jgi:hypothetical protein
MPSNPFSRGGSVLPPETFAELMDGIALAVGALEGQRLHKRNIEEARGHLRFAQRCATACLAQMGVN